MLTEAKNDQYGVHIKLFDDITDMLEHCSTPSYRNTSWKRPTFVGKTFHVWQQILDETRKPHEDVARLVTNMIEELEGLDIPEPMEHRRRLHFDDTFGDELDIDRLRAGQPFWRESRRKASVGTQTKTIIVNAVARGGISPEALQWRSCCAVVLSHLLEDAGYQCEIWASNMCNKAYTTGWGFAHHLKLKDCYGAIDVDTIATALSGWFYRTVWFESVYRCDHTTTSSLGEPRIIHQEVDVEVIAPGVDPLDLMLIENVYTEQTAIWKIKQLLTKYAEPEPEVIVDDAWEDATALSDEPGEEYVPETPSERREREAEQRRMDREYKKAEKARRAKNKLIV